MKKEELKIVEAESLMKTEGSELLLCDVDPVQIEDGLREIAIPEGIEIIGEEAFAEYNQSALVSSLAERLLHSDYYLNQWEKRTYQRNAIRGQKFPPEVRTPHEKAVYLFREEKRKRLLQLNLPSTVTTVTPKNLPAFLHRIEIAEENPAFRSIDGVLYSKDGKTLVRYPGYRDDEEYTVPDGVETILPDAFFNAALKKIVLPASLKEIGSGCFRNAVIDEVEFSEGLAAIGREAFLDCKIGSLKLPESLRIIEDYAFSGTFGLQKVECASEELSIGIGVFSRGRFRGISWWCWSEIPKAAFLNAQIDRLNIPEGVVSIGEYAFAGCYKSKSIVVAESVESIGPHSFDEGPTWNGPITLPRHLSHYLYRFPACAQFNKKGKSTLWPERENKEFLENKDVLLKQKAAVEGCMTKLNPLQASKKRRFRAQLDQIELELRRYTE